jgi:hypothetical protein
MTFNLLIIFSCTRSDCLFPELYVSTKFISMFCYSPNKKKTKTENNALNVIYTQNRNIIRTS